MRVLEIDGFECQLLICRLRSAGGSPPAEMERGVRLWEYDICS